MKKGVFDSRISGSEVSRSERILGYFVGPCLMAVVYSGVAGSYLIQFYTDVLGISGALLTLMPLISKVISALTGFVMSRMIEHSRSKQGKARPYLLVSGVLMSSAALMYAVPRGTYALQLIWIVVSYNLFFSLVHTVYSLSHSMMTPLSTRNEEQRDGLAVLSSAAVSMLPGALMTVAMPLLISRIGVGQEAQGAWLNLMGAISTLAVPAALIEYYFTLERVTLEQTGKAEEKSEGFRKCMKVCLSDGEWRRMMLFVLAMNLAGAFSSGSMIYYCNWVLGSSVAEGAAKQILVNVVGQFPLGIGAAALWPLIGRFGRRRVTCVGFAVAAAGSLIVLLAGRNMIAVLTGLIIRSVGSIPTYTLAAHQAEALDSLERRHGVRTDGFTAFAVGAAALIAHGVAQTILLCGMNALGYAVPEWSGQAIEQNPAIRALFCGCFALVPMIGYAVCSATMLGRRKHLIDWGSVR